MSLALNKDEVITYLESVFPQMENEFVLDALSDTGLTMRLKTSQRHLRPGGTISGPSMFGLADCAVYVMVLARIGRKALAVTTGCSMDFMRKPDGSKDLIAECQLLKLGKALAVGDVMIFSEGSDKPVARATMTYSIPPGD